MATKQEVREFWDRAACGEQLYLRGFGAEEFRKQAEIRYELEPFILSFAEFEASTGKRVLEIGVGLGADHQRFAEAGAVLSGIDLTNRGVEITRRRFEKLGLKSDLQVGDAEQLAFPDNTFDSVYAWGVVHHSPDTQRTVREILRVLKPGGEARVMIYHKYSLVAFMLWLRYALVAGRPLTSLDTVCAKYLESPGTKVYSQTSARELFRQFESVSINIQLTHGDLLTSRAGQRHEGPWLNVARKLWPRWLLRRLCQRNGLFILIDATKSAL